MKLRKFPFYALPFMLLLASQKVHAQQPIVFKHPGAQQMLLSADGKVVISQAKRGRADLRNQPLSLLSEIWVWNLGGPRATLVSVPVPDKTNMDVKAVSPDGKWLAIFADGGRDAKSWFQNLEIWRVENGRAQRTGVWPKPDFLLNNVCWQNGQFQVLLTRNIVTLDLRGRVVKQVELDWGKQAVVSADGVLSPDGKWAALDGYDKESNSQTAIFDTQNGRVMRRFKSLTPILFAPDNNTILTRGDYHKFEPYDPNNGPFPIQQLRDVWRDSPPYEPSQYSSYSAERLYPNMYMVGEVESQLPFSPDGKAMMGSDAIFYELKSKVKAEFQVPRPFRDDRWLNTVRVAQDGHTVASLDAKGEIWVEKVP